MKMDLNSISKKKIMVLIFVIISIQCLVSSYFMAYKKMNYYADDIYSYGTANSSGKLNPLQSEQGLWDKADINVWKAGETLVDYLTVQENEAFSYENLQITLQYDAHPPLYFIILHTICSFTINVFSRWSGFIINIVGMIFIQVYLYRLALFISKRREDAILIMTFFGLTSVNINMMCFLRMYVLSTGFVVAFTFYCLRYVYSIDDKTLSDKNLLLAFLFLYMASITDYFADIYACVLVVLLCLILIIKNKIKKMLCFGSAMLSAVVLMIITCPVLFDQLSFDQPGLYGAESYPYMLQLRMGIHVIMNGLFGVFTPIFASMLLFYLLWFTIGFAILYSIVLFLFRKDEWFKLIRIKVRMIVAGTLRKLVPHLQMLLPVILSCVIILLIYARKLLLYFYHYESVRYLFIFTPFVALTVLIVLFELFRWQRIKVMVTMIMIVTSLLFGNKCFMGGRNVTVDLPAESADADVVIIEKGITTFIFHIADIMRCKNYFYSSPIDLSENKSGDLIKEKAESSDNMILLVDINCYSLDTKEEQSVDILSGEVSYEFNPYNETYEYFRDELGFNDIEFLGGYHTCYVYRLK